MLISSSLIRFMLIKNINTFDSQNRNNYRKFGYYNSYCNIKHTAVQWHDNYVKLLRYCMCRWIINKPMKHLNLSRSHFRTN